MLFMMSHLHCHIRSVPVPCAALPLPPYVMRRPLLAAAARPFPQPRRLPGMEDSFSMCILRNESYVAQWDLLRPCFCAWLPSTEAWAFEQAWGQG